MKYLLTVLTVTITFIYRFAQQVTLSIDHWKTYLVPTNQDSLLKYNNNKGWSISFNENRIYATDSQKTLIGTLPFKIGQNSSVFDKFYSAHHVLKVDYGYLVGFDAGEWGGK